MASESTRFPVDMSSRVHDRSLAELMKWRIYHGRKTWDGSSGGHWTDCANGGRSGRVEDVLQGRAGNEVPVRCGHDGFLSVRFGALADRRCGARIGKTGSRDEQNNPVFPSAGY